MEQKYLDNLVINWLNNIKQLKYCNYTIEHYLPSEYEEDETAYIQIILYDELKNNLFIDVPLDGINSPEISFAYKNKEFEFLGDVSLYENIINLLKKFDKI